MTDYRAQHQAPRDDSNDPDPYYANITHLTDVFPDDIYEHPEFYGVVDDETMTQLGKARTSPDTIVRIYRAVPEGVTTINAGDWVTLSRGYAETHAEPGWTVLAADVPAAQVWSDGNDLAEYGWDGGANAPLTHLHGLTPGADAPPPGSLTAVPF